MTGREGETLMPDGSASSSKPRGAGEPGSPRSPHGIDRDATHSSGSLEFSPVKSGPMSDLREMYEVGRAVGKGGYAVVYKGTRRDDGTRVAIKQVDLHEMSERKRLRCLREVQLLGNLRHPGIVEMYDSFLDDEKLCIVFEWAAGGDLKRLLRKHLAAGALLDEGTVWRTFRQIAAAVAHMHERRVMHRDIKPANVLVTANGRCKVADLGLGRQFGSNTVAVDSKVGTPYYVSPEVVKGEPYDWSSDVWSLGCLLYELATLRSPFEMEGANLYAVFQRISTSSWAPLPSHRFSPPLVELVRQMMDPNPRDRPSAREVSRRCEEAVDAFDAIERGKAASGRGVDKSGGTAGGGRGRVRGSDGAAEALCDGLLVLAAESARFRPEFRPRRGTVDALRVCATPAAFLAPAPGDTAGAGFGRVVRIGSWLMKLLGRRGLSLESAIHDIEAREEDHEDHEEDHEEDQEEEEDHEDEDDEDEEEENKDDDEEVGEDGFIDAALLEAGESLAEEKTGSSGDGARERRRRRRRRPRLSRPDGDRKPPPLSALRSEALAPPTAGDARRHAVARDFLRECASLGVDVRYMCERELVRGGGWAATECLLALTLAATTRLDVRPRRCEARAPEGPPGGVPCETIDPPPEEIEEETGWDAGGEGRVGSGSDDDDEFHRDLGFSSPGGGGLDETRAPIEPSVDPRAWRAEAERLTPELVRVGHAARRDWTSRLDAARLAAANFANFANFAELGALVDSMRRDLRDIDAYESRLLERLDAARGAHPADPVRREEETREETVDGTGKRGGVVEEYAASVRAARESSARRRESLAAIESAIRSTRVAEEEARGRERVGAARCREMRRTMEAMEVEMREMETRIEVARSRVARARRTRR